jgi:uncharacterized protein YjiS (DUF1127 family)
MNWITRTAANWRDADKRRRDAALLSQMPDYLLHDIGLTRDGAQSLARQLRDNSR